MDKTDLDELLIQMVQSGAMEAMANYAASVLPAMPEERVGCDCLLDVLTAAGSVSSAPARNASAETSRVT